MKGVINLAELLSLVGSRRYVLHTVHFIENNKQRISHYFIIMSKDGTRERIRSIRGFEGLFDEAVKSAVNLIESNKVHLMIDQFLPFFSTGFYSLSKGKSPKIEWSILRSISKSATPMLTDFVTQEIPSILFDLLKEFGTKDKRFQRYWSSDLLSKISTQSNNSIIASQSSRNSSKGCFSSMSS